MAQHFVLQMGAHLFQSNGLQWSTTREAKCKSACMMDFGSVSSFVTRDEDEGELCLPRDERARAGFLRHCSGRLSGSPVIEYSVYGLGL